MSSSEPVAEWTSSLPQETNDSGRASHGPHDPTPRTVNEIPSRPDGEPKYRPSPVPVVVGDLARPAGELVLARR